MRHKRRWARHRPLFASPVPRALEKPKIKWKILPLLWLSLKRTCMLLGALVLFSALVSTFMAARIVRTVSPTLPDEMVLFLKLEDGLEEMPQGGGFSEPFAQESLTVREMVNAIDAAAGDKRVKGIFARLEGGHFDMAHVYELRTALKRFRETGKFAYIYSSSYGGMGGGLGRYYLASAFEEIWMQPMGIVGISGIHAEMPFLRGMLDKIGVQPQFFKRKDYKTAYENLTHTHISTENREMMTRLVADIRAEILSEIPADRGMEPGRFEELVHKGLFPAQDALEAGLLTRVDYVDVLLGNIREKLSGDRESKDVDFVNMRVYAHAIKVETQKQKRHPERKAGQRVALVYAVGAIVPSEIGGGARTPVFLEGGVAAADTIAPAILQAADDKTIGAIVLRIDSPGGSPVASEAILRAVERAREKGKKVIVSMGPVAASGGYWIAAYADRIFVLPTTLTGSIGVIGGKFALHDLTEKLGVNWDSVEWGKNSGMWSVNAPFSKSQAVQINAMLDQVYEGFLARVAKGRGMSVAEVDKVAGGRVWTGRRAVEVGLADEIGGLNEALDYTAQLLGVPDRTALKIEVLPKPKTPVEKLLKLLGQQVRVGQAVQFQRAILEKLRPALNMMALAENPEPYITYEPLQVE